MFWGWAQTDPAGIHASSAPREFQHIRRPIRTLSGTPRPCSGAGRKLTLRGFTHPQLQDVDAGPVLYPDALQREFQHIRRPIRTLSGTPRPCSGAGRKLTLRGFTHPQLQDMDVFGGLTRSGIPVWALIFPFLGCTGVDLSSNFVLVGD
ncbi:hypothetical protein D9611_009347 [Ephemerocybe angulata]|uniref:Uncharacterized protein n=1 Tax=Ephemerocybe angulata TaxID=980116 RepID=A0A8H5BHI6_9AGAR|nr:hypothetical protein D9611_009347 [Tulosesus angulatus]